MNKTNLMVFYEHCPKKYQFVRTVVGRTGVTLTTVINWCKGYSKTNDEHRLTVLSEETGIPKDELFNYKETKDV